MMYIATHSKQLCEKCSKNINLNKLPYSSLSHSSGYFSSLFLIRVMMLSRMSSIIKHTVSPEAMHVQRYAEKLIKWLAGYILIESSKTPSG